MLKRKKKKVGGLHSSPKLLEERLKIILKMLSKQLSFESQMMCIQYADFF